MAVQLDDLPFIELSSDGSSLRVLGTQVSDAGDYQCVAVNEAGTGSAVVSLDVGCAFNSITEFLSKFIRFAFFDN